ncbi:MAG: mechanosensitive ion channel family protein [Pseudomonadota bacterium]
MRSPIRKTWHRHLAAALTLLACLTVGAAAQDASPYQALIDEAADSGATVIIIEPDANPDAAEPMPEDRAMALGDALERAADELTRVLQESRGFLGQAGATIARAGGNEGSNWLLYTAFIALVAVAIGLVARRSVGAWGRTYFRYIYIPEPETRSQKIGYLLARAILTFLSTIAFVAVAALVTVILTDPLTATRWTTFIIIAAIALFQVYNIVLTALLAPDAPRHRMLAFDDQTASRLATSFRAVMIVATVAFALCVWMTLLGLPHSPHKLALLAATFVGLASFTAVAIAYRKPIAQAILALQDPPPLWLRVIAALWHVAAIVYLVAAWLVGSVRLLLNLPSSIGLIFGPIVILVISLAVYGLLLIIIDRWFATPPPLVPEDDPDLGDGPVEPSDVTPVEAAMETVSDAVPDASPTEATAADVSLSAAPDTGETEPLPHDEGEPISIEPPVLKSVAEKAAGLTVLLGILLALLDLWGVDVWSRESLARSAFDIVVVCLLAFMAYEAARLWIDRKINEEEGPEGGADTAESGEGMGQGATRLATLLPIFRNFLLATIVSIAIMIVLSEMGVDIGPLFAGAGVVGIAIGFGAQTLIRDIFSGAFFLMDDAFRKGEYIDVGSAKGTVEKISIRSFQLRHHNGPLNTVPFGEIHQITNFSRDWVMMKLPIRLTYNTDPEKVRKLVKKLGQQLLADEEFGHMFMEPLKSQGVIEMDDSAMIVRVKFMTKPGDQFTLRRVVYHRVRQLFEQEGIEFASREVRVRLADENDDEPRQVTEQEKLLAAAAIQPILDEEAKAAAGGAGQKADDR